MRKDNNLKPKVSIIMAAYNCESTIIESIESIINQTFTEWEFIICDDGSTDNTYKIIESYAQKYPNKIIAIRNKENSKLPYSLNHCLEYAKGEYVARMDADDKCYPERIAKQYMFLQEHPEFDVVGTGMTCFDDKKITGQRFPAINPGPENIGLGVPFFHATIMMKKQVYKELKGYSLKKYVLRCEDVDLWIRFFGSGFKGANLQETLYYVREDIVASKRRTFKNAINSSKTLYHGFRTYHYPKKQYIYVLKPMISVLIPAKAKYLINRIRWKR